MSLTLDQRSVLPIGRQLQPDIWVDSESQQLPRLPLRLVVGLSEMLFFFNDCAVCLAGSQFPNQGLNPGHGSESQEL